MSPGPLQQLRPVLYWIGLTGILLFAFLVRLPGGFSRLIQHDEFFHYFAGLSYAHNGTLAIGDGRYVRAAPYTILTGLSMKAFGNGLLALRLPAILSGAFLVFAVTWWLGLVNRLAGVIGGGLLALDNFAIQVSDYARFYTLHALMIWLAAISSYALFTKRRPWPATLLLAVAAAASLSLAVDLQILTLFVIVALIAWLVADYLIFSSYAVTLEIKRRLAIALCCTAIAAIVVLKISPAGNIIFSLYDKFWSVAPWGEKQSTDLLYYLRFMRTYGLLVYTFPIAVFIACRVDRRFTLFCVMLMVIPLVFASIGPQKATRYIFYVIPFFLSVWALAGVWIVAVIQLIIRRRKLPAQLSWVIVAIAGIALAVGTSTYRSTLGKLRRFALTGEVVSVEEMKHDGNFDWRPWMPLLRQAISPAGIIVGVDDLRTLYFFGRLDLLLNKTIQSDISRREFIRDPRTGVIAISQPSSISFVMRCIASGSIIVPLGTWRNYSVIPATADVIEKRARRVPLPAGAPFRVYSWQNSAPLNRTSCPPLASRAVSP